MVKGRNEDEWETMTQRERYIKDYAHKKDLRCVEDEKDDGNGHDRS